MYKLKDVRMKRSMRSMTIGLMLASLMACKENSKTTSDKTEVPAVEETTPAPVSSTASAITFKDDNVSEQFEAYLMIKESLVEGDAKRAAENAAALKTASTGNTEMEQAANMVAASDDIAAQREHFVTLTALMETAISGNLVSGTVYKQYCPMAFDNKGGYWLSASSEILNPYFGDAMLRCGSVKEMIE